MTATFVRASLMIAIVPLAACPGSAGDAPSLFQSHFASQDGGAPCYARTYPAEHLKDHPEQRVARIIVDLDKTDADGKPITEAALALGFGVQLKTSPEWYTNTSVCKSAGAEISCFLEGDGGSFAITAAEDGAIKIATGSYGIAMEGSKDFIELSAGKGDDKVFILKLAPQSECDAASADTADKK